MRWEWLLVVNAPIALIACIGVRLGVPADRREDLTEDTLDLPGAALSISTIGLLCYSLTSGVQHGWLSALTIASIVGGVLAGVAFVWHERRTASPMLDLGLFSSGTVRGAAIAQVGTAIAMASVMFGLILHFQFAYGWSPVRAGLANLPMIVTIPDDVHDVACDVQPGGAAVAGVSSRRRTAFSSSLRVWRFVGAFAEEGYGGTMVTLMATRSV